MNEVILSEAGDNDDDDENRDTRELLGRWGSFQKQMYCSKRTMHRRVKGLRIYFAEDAILSFLI